LPKPGTFRPQGFAPSRRLAPRSDVRPCFMPVTSMGFTLQGVPLATRSRSSSLRECPLDVSPPCKPLATMLLANSESRRRDLCGPVPLQSPFGRLQGLAPVTSPCRRSRCYPEYRTVVPLLGFCTASPGTYRVAGHGARSVLRSCALPTCLPPVWNRSSRDHVAHSQAALQRFTQQVRVLSLSASARPS
jgi:hypothetical protein